jgi:radical SAM superfamily enzyme YgiQ (UPF0313 family)
MPLALPLLAGAAPDHDYELVDMLADPPAAQDFDRPFDLVGISVRMTAEKTAYEIADEYRRRGVPVVLGGPQVSAVPFRAIEHADAVVIGEGEFLWPTIVEDAANKELKDFYVCRPEEFRSHGHSVHQVHEWPDLRHLPRARRDLFGRSYDFDTVFAARGCPVDCDFCGVSRLFGKKTRLRPIGQVVEEIEGLGDFFYLLDDTVFGRPGTYAYYLSLYQEIRRSTRRRCWTGQANLGAVNSPQGRDVIRAAVRAGLLYAAVGMESINPRVLRRNGALVKTGLSSSQDPVQRMKEQISFLQDLGILVSGWFTLGYEEDSLETFYRTVDFCNEVNVMPVLCPVNALPGTRLLERLRAEGKLDWKYSLTNYRHPRMKKSEVIEALEWGRLQGYSVAACYRRSRLLAQRLIANRDNQAQEIVKKTVFSLVLQYKMRQILGRENHNLAAPWSQNAFGDEPCVSMSSSAQVPRT